MSRDVVCFFVQQLFCVCFARFFRLWQRAVGKIGLKAAESYGIIKENKVMNDVLGGINIEQSRRYFHTEL